MIAVCFEFGPQTHLQQGRISDMDRWCNLAEGFGATHIYIVDRGGLAQVCYDNRTTDASPIAITYGSITEAFQAHQDKVWVFSEVAKHIPDSITGESLDSFVHPQGDVVYAFGYDSGGILFYKINMRPTDRALYIDGTNSFYSIVAAAIVMQSRKHSDDGA